MNTKVLSIAVLISLSASGVAWADDGFTGKKIDGQMEPDFTITEIKPQGLEAESDVQAEKTAVKRDAKNNTRSERKKKSDKKEVKANQQTLPVTLYGDHVTYHQDTGDFSAEGKVRVYQGTQSLYTTRVEGNMKTGDVYIKQEGRMVEGDTSTTSQWSHYNFNSKTGELKEIKGKSKTEYFKGEHAFVYPDRMEMDKGGSTTACPAVKHAPCLLVKADRVVMYPHDKIIAYGVKVYLKGKHIYSRDRWINKLDDKDKVSLMPHIGYTSDHGWEISHELQYPLSDKTTASFLSRYYTKIGWRPMLSARHDEKNFYVKYQNGFNEDSENNWIKKQNDVTFGYKSHRFTKQWPLSYSGYISKGLWRDDWKSSWHTEAAVYISHDRMHFLKDKSLFLDLGVGHKWINESITDETTRTLLYNATLGKSFAAGWSTWLGYYWQKNDTQVFAYNLPDMARELQFGINKRFDAQNSASAVVRYDEGKSKLYEYIFRFTRDFCCWRLTLEYTNKQVNNEHKWRLNYDFYRW